MKMHRFKMTVIALMGIAVFALTGCASNDTAEAGATETDLLGVTAIIARRLADDMDIRSGKPFLAVSFANLDDLRTSSTLGRTLGEQISTSMTQLGIPMIEIKMRTSLFMEAGTGELMLSRELKNLVKVHDAEAVVLGTYAMGGSRVYISARVVRTQDNIILASTNYALPITPDITTMLRSRR